MGSVALIMGYGMITEGRLSRRCVYWNRAATALVMIRLVHQNALCPVHNRHLKEYTARDVNFAITQREERAAHMQIRVKKSSLCNGLNCPLCSCLMNYT